MRLMKKQEQGRTLVEMMGVISLIGLLTVLSIGGYRFVNGNLSASKIDDALLKSILVVDGGQVKTLTGLDRFYSQAMPGKTVNVESISSCDNKTAAKKYCYKVTLTGESESMSDYFLDSEASEYKVDKTATKEGTIVFEFASNKRLCRDASDKNCLSSR